MRFSAVAVGIIMMRVVGNQVQIPAVINDLGDLGTFLLGMAAMGAIIVWAIKTFRRDGRNGGVVQPHSVESLINIIAARVSEVQRRSDGLDQAIRQVTEWSERVPWDGLERRQHPRS